MRIQRIEFVLFNWHSDGFLRVVTAAHVDKDTPNERIECIEVSRDSTTRSSENYFRGMTVRRSVSAMRSGWTKLGFKNRPANAVDLELARPYLQEDTYLAFRRRFVTPMPTMSLRSRFQAFV